MEIVWMIVIGAVVGVLARLLMPGHDPLGILGTILVGVVGVFLGGYLWREFFGDTRGVEWIGSILAAMVLLWMYRRFSFRRPRAFRYR